MKYSALKSVAGLKFTLRPPHWRRGLLLVSCAAILASLAFSPTARAVVPAPDGGYPNDNTAEGDSALNDINTNVDSDNTAIGFEAMGLSETCNFNTAVGSQALEFAFQTNANTGIGFAALFQVGPGDNNTGIGASALGLDTAGSNNTAVGEGSLFFNTNGNNNTCLGFNALNNSTGSSNIAIGESAGTNLTSGKNNIDIGNAGNAGESGKIRIGNKANKNTFIAGISGATVAGGVGVVVDSNGQLGTVTSSARYKEAIRPMNKSSEAILSLKPVTFRYKKELDPKAIPQFGLVAEDVAKVDSSLVARDEEGKPYTVRYEAVNAMLLNEFLKEHSKVEEQSRKLEQLETTVTKLQDMLQKQNDPASNPASANGESME